MANILKRGSSYLVRWREHGVQVARTCPDAQTARELKRDVERAHALGRPWAPEARTERHRLEDVIVEFLKDVRRTRTAATLANYTSALARFLDYTGDIAMMDISRPLLERWFDKLEETVQANTRNAYLRQVQLFWAWAADRDEYSPQVPPPKRISLPSLTETPVIAPTWAECDRVIAELTRKPAQGSPSLVGYRAAVIIRYTGLRLHQAISLRTDDLLIDKALLRIRGELGKSKGERQGRIIPVSAHLVDEVKGWELGETLTGSTGLSSSVGPIIRQAWLRTGSSSELFDHRPAHAFRRAFTTELARLGAGIEEVEHLLGHAPPGSRRRYLDPESLALRRTVALISKVGSHGDQTSKARGVTP